MTRTSVSVISSVAIITNYIGLAGKGSFLYHQEAPPDNFSLGEKTPVMTIKCNDYCKYKNTGALRIFGLERFSVRVEYDPPSKVGELINEINSDNDKIKSGIRSRLTELRELRQDFFKRLAVALQ